MNTHNAFIPIDFNLPDRFLAIDFETATTNRYACQLGIAIVQDGQIVEQKEFLIQPPQNCYDIRTILVHGITPEMTEDAPSFDYIWNLLEPMFRRQIIVAHNASFDIDVLQKNIDYYNLSRTVFKTICTCKLLGNASLYSACKYFGIDIPQHHNALSDAVACAKLLLECDKHKGEVLFIPKVKEPVADRSLSHDVKKQNLDECVNKDTIFYDKRVVITGVFDQFPIREDLALLLKSYGADINSSISKRTDIVLVGRGFGPIKMQKVREINLSGSGTIRIIKEEELLTILP